MPASGVKRKVKGKPKAADVLPMKKAKALAIHFLGEKRPRYAALVALGAGLGLRISDAIEVTWRDILDENGSVRKSVVVRERKTGNTRIVFLIPWAREVLAEVAELVGAKNRLYEPVVGRLSRQRAWEVLKRTAEELGWHEHISTHSLRKAFCDFVYEQTRDPIMAARLTGHANPAHLLRYIRRVPEAEMAVWRRIAEADV